MTSAAPHVRRGLAERYAAKGRREVRLSTVAAVAGLKKLFFSHDLTHAAAIAYYGLLSLFPFLLLLVTVLGSLAAKESDRAAVLSFIFRYFPTRFDFLARQLDAFREHPISVGVTGALGLIWGSLGVFNALMSAVNEAWGVTEPRGFWKQRLASFVMFATATGAMILGLFLVSVSDVLGASGFSALTQIWWIAAIRSLALQYLATILFIVGCGLVYYFAPSERARFRDVWVGAVFTGLLWRGAFEGFSWLMTRNAEIQAVNGSIAVVVMFLMWVYVSSVILMYGAEFTAAHYRARRRHVAVR